MPWAATGSRGGSRRRPSAGTNTGRRWAAEASRRAAPRRRSPPRCRTGLEVTVAELAGVLAEDLTGRATDVAQSAKRLLDEGAAGVARGVHAHRDDREDRDSGQLAPRLASARTMAMLLRRYRDFDGRAVALEGAMEQTVPAGTVSSPSAGHSPSAAGAAGHPPRRRASARPVTGLLSASCHQNRRPPAAGARPPRGRARSPRAAWSRRSRAPPWPRQR